MGIRIQETDLSLFFGCFSDLDFRDYYKIPNIGNTETIWLSLFLFAWRMHLFSHISGEAATERRDPPSSGHRFSPFSKWAAFSSVSDSVVNDMTQYYPPSPCLFFSVADLLFQFFCVFYFLLHNIHALLSFYQLSASWLSVCCTLV